MALSKRKSLKRMTFEFGKIALNYANGVPNLASTTSVDVIGFIRRVR